MVRRIRKCNTATIALLIRHSHEKVTSQCEKNQDFSRTKRREKKITEGCLCRKSHGGALKLVASLERLYTRLLAGSQVIFHCTSSPRDPLNFLSRSHYLCKNDSSSYENDARILYCIIPL